MVLTLRASAMSLAGRPIEALAIVDEAATIAPPGSWDDAFVQIQRGDLLVAIGDAAGAETALRSALAVAERGGVRAGQLAAATRLARLSTGARADAIATLQAVLPV